MKLAFRNKEERDKHIAMLWSSLKMYNNTLEETRAATSNDSDVVCQILAARGDIEAQLLDAIECKFDNGLATAKEVKEFVKTNTDTKRPLDDDNFDFDEYEDDVDWDEDENCEEDGEWLTNFFEELDKEALTEGKYPTVTIKERACQINFRYGTTDKE